MCENTINDNGGKGPKTGATVRAIDVQVVERFLEILRSDNPTDEMIHELFEPYRRRSVDWTFGERVKTIVVLIFLVPFRLLYLLLAGAVILLIARIGMIGWPLSKVDEYGATGGDNDAAIYQPLERWRRFLLNLSFPLIRSILFVTFGIYYISEDIRVDFSLYHHLSHPRTDTSLKDATVVAGEGKEALPPSDEEPKAYVIVSNHLGYIDILILMCAFRGSFVSKGEYESMPIIGTLSRALQCMFVHKGQSLTTKLVQRVRTTHECHASHVKKCGSRRCYACMTSLVIFSEGTTTNGYSMIPFRTGVFNAGVPVQPVCVDFANKDRQFNMSWESIRFRHHLFRTITQFRNVVRCTRLPVYVPSDAEIVHARLFARNVQYEMCLAMNNHPIVPLNRQMKFLYHKYLLGQITDRSELLDKAKQLLQEDNLLTDYINFVLPQNNV